MKSVKRRRVLSGLMIYLYIMNHQIMWAASAPSKATYTPPTSAPNYRECIETFNNTFVASTNELNSYIKDADAVVKDGVVIFNTGSSEYNKGLSYTSKVKDNLVSKDATLNATGLNSDNENAKKHFAAASQNGSLAFDYSNEATARFKQAYAGQDALFTYLNSCRDYLTQRQEILNDQGKDFDKVIAILVALEAGSLTYYGTGGAAALGGWLELKSSAGL